MNLTIEQMREIVAGAPEWAVFWITRNEYHGSVLSFPNMTGQQSYLISDLKAQIDQHYYGRSEAEELAAYAELSQEKIEGGAMLVGDLGSAKKKIQSVLDDDRTDHVSDIHNHVAPTTRVIEG